MGLWSLFSWTPPLPALTRQPSFRLPRTEIPFPDRELCWVAPNFLPRCEHLMTFTDQKSGRLGGWMWRGFCPVSSPSFHPVYPPRRSPLALVVSARGWRGGGRAAQDSSPFSRIRVLGTGDPPDASPRESLPLSFEDQLSVFPSETERPM